MMFTFEFKKKKEFKLKILLKFSITVQYIGGGLWCLGLWSGKTCNMSWAFQLLSWVLVRCGAQFPWV